MKNKWLYEILILGVTFVISNALASTPGIGWANQATLSPPNDYLPDQDPENYGFGMVQVSVWEHWEPTTASWDIYMKYSLNDGALGSWIFSPVWPAATGVDEVNPAVCVTRTHPITGQEIHVVYQRFVPPPVGPFWEICHTYTANFGVAWSPVIILSTALLNAENPACCYTEDLAFPGAFIGFLCQVVWEESIPLNPAFTRIMYDAFVYDPTWPARGTLPGGPFIVQVPPALCSSKLPEIASVDERWNPMSYDHTFSITWQEEVVIQQNPLIKRWNIWYPDGTTTTSSIIVPPPPVWTLTLGSTGQINVGGPLIDCYDPDIAATQDYQNPETYFFHIDYVQLIINIPFQTIESSYSLSAFPTPGFASFIATLPVFAPPVVIHILDRPTVATHVIGLLPSVFETFFAWEYSIGAGGTPDIWYSVGQSVPGGGLMFTVGGVGVPYGLPIVPGDSECNPELWNRNDITRNFPPATVTHLVFDWTPPAGITEVEYIDP